jgi:hypothetical protein
VHCSNCCSAAQEKIYIKPKFRGGGRCISGEKRGRSVTQTQAPQDSPADLVEALPVEYDLALTGRHRLAADSSQPSVFTRILVRPPTVIPTAIFGAQGGGGCAIIIFPRKFGGFSESAFVGDASTIIGDGSTIDSLDDD